MVRWTAALVSTGGTVDLTYRFGLRHRGIASLEILPTEAAES
jgi:hypothetical protein